MSEVKKPFTVNDRRHFTAEGETREGETSQKESAQPREESPAPGPVAGAAQANGGERPRPALDFSGLLLSLGAQASLLLGLGGEDDAGEPPDLQGAQAIISLLEVLRDKTEGRRTEDEQRILEGILYELRMAYVARTRTGGA